MDTLFFAQLATSFFVGGGFITLLIFIAEKLPPNLRGIILPLPSTSAISFLFLGWVISPEAVGRVAPLLIVGMGAVMAFLTTYLYVSKIVLQKAYSIMLSSLASIGVWFLVIGPVVLYDIDNLLLFFLIYILGLALAHIAITKKTSSIHDKREINYTTTERLVRFLFVACIITSVVFLGKTLGEFWGGMFAAFPAAVLSTLLILHRRYDSAFLFQTFRNFPVGSVTIIIFGYAAAYTFPTYGLVWGVCLAYLCSIIYSTIVGLLQK